MSNETRDCKNCIHKVPVFDEEEGIWRGAECDSWECNFVSRAEALKAYKELREAKEALEIIKERYILIEKSPRDNPNDLLVAKMPERHQGEWIDYDNTFYKCPECGYLLEKCCPVCQNKVILPKGGAE